jgi:hypothetical protein
MPICVNDALRQKTESPRLARFLDARFSNRGNPWRLTRPIHHQGYGRFVVDGPTIKLKSKMR